MGPKYLSQLLTTSIVISIRRQQKNTNELIAHVYSHLYNLPTTGLRFFTVYGPWGDQLLQICKAIAQ